MRTRKAFLSLLPVLLMLVPLNRIPAFSTTPEESLRKYHYSIHTVDTHTDTPLRFFGSDLDLGTRNEGGCVDLPRMAEGGLDSVFFAIFLGQGERNPDAFAKVHRRTLDIFRYIRDVLQRYPDRAALALTPDDALELEKQNRSAVFIGIENGYPLGTDLERLTRYYQLGARYITLCHSRNNQICDSSTDEPEHGGLSEFGKKVVKEMNRLGMIIDVSHLSDQSFFDVIALSRAPIMASHSCARSLCDHPRNLSDRMLRALAKNQGVIQVCFVSDFVKKMPENPERTKAFRQLRARYRDYDSLSEEQKKKAREEWYRMDRKYPANYASVSDLANHIDYIVDLVGIDHVGIGSDFDGGGKLKDLQDVSQIMIITGELLKRGYTREQISQIWGGNFFRVFRAVINAAGPTPS